VLKLKSLRVWVHTCGLTRTSYLPTQSRAQLCSSQVTWDCFGSSPQLLQQVPCIMFPRYPKLGNPSEPVLEQGWVLCGNSAHGSANKCSRNFVFPSEKQAHSKGQRIPVQHARPPAGIPILQSALPTRTASPHPIQGLPGVAATVFSIGMCTLWI